MTNQLVMRATLFAIICSTFFSFGQESEIIVNNESLFFIPEFLIGHTIDLDSYLPDTKFRTDLVLSIGKQHFNLDLEWAYRLNNPKSGLSFAYTNFGNNAQLGHGISVLPFIEFEILDRLYIHSALGPTFINKVYDPIDNPNNERINRHLNWSFRLFITYNIIQTEKVNYRLGAGYFHHSNNHTRLPNLGLNSLMLSASAQIDTKPKNTLHHKPSFAKSNQTYFTSRVGFGFNALSEEFNYLKPVYTLAVSFGKIKNRTFKFGGGLYYRFYQHYYNYIINEEELVTTEFPYFTDDPFTYSTALGVFGNFELLLSHIGLDFNIGFNIYKPFYIIDYKLHKRYETTDENGEIVSEPLPLNIKYDAKKAISGRLGIKYYWLSNNETPKNNFYLAAHINSNFGEADFPEFSLGYVYEISFKQH